MIPSFQVVIEICGIECVSDIKPNSIPLLIGSFYKGNRTPISQCPVTLIPPSA